MELDFSRLTVRDVLSFSGKDYESASINSMKSRFSHFSVTPEQEKAWQVGFKWIYESLSKTNEASFDWIICPEFTAPLISGRPDLVIATARFLLVVEMKTGHLPTTKSAEQQTMGYAIDLWGKFKAARSRTVLPILLSDSGKTFSGLSSLDTEDEPDEVLKLNPKGFSELLTAVAELEIGLKINSQSFDADRLYSPRPSVVQAATSLVAKLEDKNVITGLSESKEIDRVILSILNLATTARSEKKKLVAIVTGSPGTGKTLVGLRVAHDKNLQKNLNGELGTPLYLTGNGPLVEVLIESLARDQSIRTNFPLSRTRADASAKVKLVHSVIGAKLGIESNVVIFDEGQRIWTEERMKKKKKDQSVGSEADEILSALDGHEWSLLVVLVGEGQEINTGEAGIVTWVDAVEKANTANLESWHLYLSEASDHEMFSWMHLAEELTLKANIRSDNSANVSDWVAGLLLGDSSSARGIRQSMQNFPIYMTRDLQTAKDWIRQNVRETPGTSGVLASSRSKRLLNYGVDVASDSNRNFKWDRWYLNSLPDLYSSAALEVAATEFKCQGLELDWSLVCWSWDMIYSGKDWQPRTLDARNDSWKLTENQERLAYQINAYRVLLTRSRRGMVIWVPDGEPTSGSMSPTEMDSVADFLQKCGIESLDYKEN